MNRFLKVMLLSCFFMLCIGIAYSFAGEVDILVNKLVEKGILTAGEAAQIVTETKEEARAELAAGKSQSVPTWVQNIKLKGDFRARYQFNKKKGSEDRHRERIRLRIGAESIVADNFKLGFGLATGDPNGEPRSTNQTLTGVFSAKPISVDYAYGEYSPTPWSALTVGKFKNPIWEPSDFLWDTDLNPEGIAGRATWDKIKNLSLFLNAGLFLLGPETTADTSDPAMFMIQPGLAYQITPSVNLKGAVSLYDANSVEGQLITTSTSVSAGTNSGLTKSGTTIGGAYRYDYDCVNPSVELSIKDPILLSELSKFGIYIPYLSFFAEYVKNPEPDKGRTGYLYGLKFGSEKVNAWGVWQMRLQYGKLGRDAWLDVLPDSDRYSGATNMKAFEAIWELGLGKNTNFALDYYYGKSLTKPGDNPEHLWQADLNFKF